MHLKRLLAPKFWKVSKKEKKFIVAPSPGPHPKNRSIPLKVLIRDILGYAENSLEAKKILNAGKVLIDKKIRKSPKFPVGLMDIVEIPDADKYFRISVDKNGLCLEEIEKNETGTKLCKIIGKTVIKGGKIQLNLHDGKNILVDNGSYKVGDSVKISLPKPKILAHYRLQPGAEVLIINGKNMGLKGRIKEIRERKTMLERGTVKIEINGKEIETARDYVFAIPRGEK